jgi:hypothetical protein
MARSKQLEIQYPEQYPKRRNTTPGIQNIVKRLVGENAKGLGGNDHEGLLITIEPSHHYLNWVSF